MIQRNQDITTKKQTENTDSVFTEPACAEGLGARAGTESCNSAVRSGHTLSGTSGCPQFTDVKAETDTDFYLNCARVTKQGPGGAPRVLPRCLNPGNKL